MARPLPQIFKHGESSHLSTSYSLDGICPQQSPAYIRLYQRLTSKWSTVTQPQRKATRAGLKGKRPSNGGTALRGGHKALSFLRVLACPAYWANPIAKETKTKTYSCNAHLYNRAARCACVNTRNMVAVFFFFFFFFVFFFLCVGGRGFCVFLSSVSFAVPRALLEKEACIGWPRRLLKSKSERSLFF